MTEIEKFIKQAEERGAISKEDAERAIAKYTKDESKKVTGEVWIGNKQLTNENIQLRAVGERGTKALSIYIQKLEIEVLVDGNEVMELLELLEA
jgi:hypothetical protein